MLLFDYYAYGEAKPEFDPMAQPGHEGWLDGCNGFFDQYFESKNTGDLIRFVAVPGTGVSLPNGVEGFKRIPLFEATITVNERIDAKVRIESRAELGTWARQVALAETTSLDNLTMLSGTERKAVEMVRDAALPKGEFLWVSDARFWDYRRWFELTAAYAFVHEKELRCVLLATYSTPSMLIKLSG